MCGSAWQSTIADLSKYPAKNQWKASFLKKTFMINENICLFEVNYNRDYSAVLLKG